MPETPLVLYKSQTLTGKDFFTILYGPNADRVTDVTTTEQAEYEIDILSFGDGSIYNDPLLALQEYLYMEPYDNKYGSKEHAPREFRYITEDGQGHRFMLTAPATPGQLAGTEADINPLSQISVIEQINDGIEVALPKVVAFADIVDSDFIIKPSLSLTK